METDLVESLRVRYQFKELPAEGRPQLDIDALDLPDFCIHENGMISAVVKLSERWNLSVVNTGLMGLPFDEGLENNWEIGFLYNYEFFDSIWLLLPIFKNVVSVVEPSSTIISHLSLAQVNELIPLLKSGLGGTK